MDKEGTARMSGDGTKTTASGGQLSRRDAAQRIRSAGRNSESKREIMAQHPASLLRKIRSPLLRTAYPQIGGLNIL